MRVRRILAVTAVLATAMLWSGGVQPVAAGGGGICADPPAPLDAAGVEVSMRHSCYAPMILRVEPGTEVTFRNDDPYLHTVTGFAAPFPVENGHQTDGMRNWRELGAGDTVQLRFDEPGVHVYACLIHPMMAGAVVVGDGVPSATSSAATSSAESPATSVPAAPSEDDLQALGPVEPASTGGGPTDLGAVWAGTAAVGALAIGWGLRSRRSRIRPFTPES